MLLHGWGIHSAIWQDFALLLAENYCVICLDLPGYGNSAALDSYSLNNIVDLVLGVIPAQRFSLLGWSMGATLALAIAQHAPERISALYCLAANPKFIATENWSGVSTDDFARLFDQLQQDPRLCLQRFQALQVLGLSNAKVLLQTLKLNQQQVTEPDPAALQSGLLLLQQADFREYLKQLSFPCQFIFAEQDQLSPIACAEAVQRINADIKVTVINQAGHLLCLSNPKELYDSLIKRQ